MTPPPVLDITGLHVTYANGAVAVRGTDLTVSAGEALALVGESGSGKTTVAHAVLGLLPRGTATTGSITVAGRELVGADRKTRQALRGDAIGYVGQDPFTAFDPRLRVGTSVAEAWRAKGRTPPPGAVTERLTALGIPDAEAAARRHPHTWSGGMLQRAAIAAATAHDPALVVADEPTSALDADLADATLAHLRATGAALLLITHDLRLAARHADRVAVMYAGRITETGPATAALTTPRHPYTQALTAALPRPAPHNPIPSTPHDSATRPVVPGGPVAPGRAASSGGVSGPGGSAARGGSSGLGGSAGSGGVSGLGEPVARGGSSGLGGPASSRGVSGVGGSAARGGVSGLGGPASSGGVSGVGGPVASGRSVRPGEPVGLGASPRPGAAGSREDGRGREADRLPARDDGRVRHDTAGQDGPTREQSLAQPESTDRPTRDALLPRPIPGDPPSALRGPDTGCAFAPRCALATARCRRTVPVLTNGVACGEVA
ncbi:ATP-binding cassette domain-containing protein [Yinghuangia sp. ASG 101]|uniref:ATP-binding cassette domain-containing protein n=1 Tax=Yinghuangia sp. ASG 101 TaxID=2896848 RepID=UPI001E5539C4|nr:ATP-binding cassette domain-containing protein [Yinghuangia sp. ASG 101]UGQ12197.1 ATP-binding cassette domain-containing protein [Yinghuangia sp. ASG 101]